MKNYLKIMLLAGAFITNSTFCAISLRIIGQDDVPKFVDELAKQNLTREQAMLELINAIRLGAVKIVGFLLDHYKFDVNYQTGSITLLTEAASSAKPEVVQLLLDRGASYDWNDQGARALAEAERRLPKAKVEASTARTQKAKEVFEKLAAGLEKTIDILRKAAKQKASTPEAPSAPAGAGSDILPAAPGGPSSSSTVIQKN